MALPSNLSLAQLESYAKKTATPPNLVAADSITILKDSVDHTKLVSGLPEQKKYYTYMVTKGNNGTPNVVKKLTLYFVQG